jgi:hypothetical protein
MLTITNATVVDVSNGTLSRDEAEEQPFDVLVRSGLTLPSPEELDDAQITVKLWEAICGMSFLRMFLSFTDHLGDRELYAHLWTIRSECRRSWSRTLPGRGISM